MRKSSRGNPYHDERGRFCHGPTAKTDTWGNPISDEQRKESVLTSEKTEEEYKERTRIRTIRAKKEHMADVVRFANPANDDYHTWIRSADDVKTFEELKDAVAEGVTPDFTEKDYEEALSSGEIRVYSSHDIKTGTFVTPSKMEAEAYGGGGYHAMKVKIDEVAWIDGGQGQYIGDGRFTDDYGIECEVIDGNCHAALCGKVAPSYIRCRGAGGEDYDASKIEPISNYNVGVVNKPFGGVWMSASNAKFGWNEWVEQEKMEGWNDNPTEFTVKGARILHIYDMETISRLPKDDNGFVDFEALTKHYDAIEYHASERESGVSRYFAGWDCDSTIFFSGEHISRKK